MKAMNQQPDDNDTRPYNPLRRPDDEVPHTPDGLRQTPGVVSIRLPDFDAQQREAIYDSPHGGPFPSCDPHPAPKQPLEELLAELQDLAEKSNAIIYQILFRRAGVGIQWHEESRVTTKDYSGSDMRIATATLTRQKDEGLVIYSYSTDLCTAIESELDRLKKVLHDAAIKKDAPPVEG